MKAILLSVRSKWVAKILNGNKTIEVRKKFPKDYKGWVYIYCTKDSDNLLHKNVAGIWWVEDKEFQKKSRRLGIEQQPSYNGKVVARFYCDGVGIINHIISSSWSRFDDYYDAIICYYYTYEDLLNESCLNHNDFHNYLKGENGYGISISQLEIFDKPKELLEFQTYKTYNIGDLYNCHLSLTKAPQNFVYIEVE